MAQLFFESVISMTAPFAAFGDAVHEFQSNRRDNSGVHIYVVDILSGWASGVQIADRGFDAALASIGSKAISEISEEFAVRVRSMSKTRGATSTREMIHCFCCAVASLRTGPAYSSVMTELGSPAGHWFFVGYTMYDGSYHVQPSFIPPHKDSSNANLFARDVSRIVDEHMTLFNSGRSDSEIGRTFKKGGGPILPIV
jgi:hypothetical protein